MSLAFFCVGVEIMSPPKMRSLDLLLHQILWCHLNNIQTAKQRSRYKKFKHFQLSIQVEEMCSEI